MAVDIKTEGVRQDNEAGVGEVPPGCRARLTYLGRIPFLSRKLHPDVRRLSRHLLLPFREPPTGESYLMNQLPDTLPEERANNSDPSVGAQYRWSARFASGHPELWGALCRAGSLCAVLSDMIPSLIIFNDESYEATGWKSTLYMLLAFVAGPLMYNLFTRETLNIIENISGVCHVGSLLCRLHRCAGYAPGAQ